MFENLILLSYIFPIHYITIAVIIRILTYHGCKCRSTLYWYDITFLEYAYKSIFVALVVICMIGKYIFPSIDNIITNKMNLAILLLMGTISFSAIIYNSIVGLLTRSPCSMSACYITLAIRLISASRLLYMGLVSSYAIISYVYGKYTLYDIFFKYYFWLVIYI
jgi:hypothetical protein